MLLSQKKKKRSIQSFMYIPIITIGKITFMKIRHLEMSALRAQQHGHTLTSHQQQLKEKNTHGTVIFRHWTTGSMGQRPLGER